MDKIVAIHQPNYLPWLGYFYKIMNCDTFVFLDNVQYEKNGYTNRNLIKTAQGSFWLTVGVLTKGNSEQLINEVKINNSISWNENHWKSLSQSYARAAHFHEYEDEFKAIYFKKWTNLAELNEALILACCRVLKINGVEFIRASSLDVHGKGTDLLIDICRAVGSDTYLSGYGGAKYMESDKFIGAGISLKYYNFEHPIYHQLWGTFIPNLSIIDLLFNEGQGSFDILRSSFGRELDSIHPQN